MTSNTVIRMYGLRRINGREPRTQSIATRFTRSEERQVLLTGPRLMARICANGHAMFCCAAQ